MARFHSQMVDKVSDLNGPLVYLLQLKEPGTFSLDGYESEIAWGVVFAANRLVAEISNGDDPDMLASLPKHWTYG